DAPGRERKAASGRARAARRRRGDRRPRVRPAPAAEPSEGRGGLLEGRPREPRAELGPWARSAPAPGERRVVDELLVAPARPAVELRRAPDRKRAFAFEEAWQLRAPPPGALDTPRRAVS